MWRAVTSVVWRFSAGDAAIDGRLLLLGCAILIAALITLPAAIGRGQAMPPVAGRSSEYTVQRGDSLYRIARKHGVSAVAIQWANRLTTTKLKPGVKLQLPLRFIPPASPPRGILLNVPERAVYVFNAGKLVARYPVAVGKPGLQTARGSYVLKSKAINPTWYPPRYMVENEGVKDEPVPPGPENPLGDRWMGWSRPGFGFHSTTSPRSIGRAASHGCVRLYPEQARRMFSQVAPGIPILSLYEPAVIGMDGGRFYLSVFPDVYRTGAGTEDGVRKKLAKFGILSVVDAERLRRVVREARGVPILIAGESEQIQVNGLAVATFVQPVLVGGIWMVPARPVAESLGGQIRFEGGVVIERGVSRLVVSNGEAIASRNDQPIVMAAPATSLRGTLMLPLRPLLELFGATAQWNKGRSINIVTP